MASGSGPQRNSQLGIDSPRPRPLASPYPSRPPTTSRNCPPIIHGSTSTRGNPSAGVPRRTELTSLEAMLKSVKSRFGQLLPIRSALDELEGCVACVQIREQHWNKYEELISCLTNLIPVLWRPFMESNPKNMPQEVCDIAKLINKKLEDFRAVQDCPQAGTDENEERLTLKCFQGLSEHFRQLQAEISAWEKQREQWTDARRKDLLPTHESYYNAALPTAVTKRVGCTENTRVDLLNDLWIWSRAHDTAKIYWLNGMAGTGKTTIAYTMCKRLQDDGRLAASFFCSRNSLECRDVNKMVPTIAYQLGQPGLYSNSYRYRLCTAFEEDTDVARRDISTQFENLIAKPLSTMGKAMPSNMVVVIDALDECTDVHGSEAVLDMLLRHVENLPVKFFVTSRPEPAIIQRMTTGSGAMRSILWLHDIDRSLVQADIRTYLADALRSIRVSSSELDTLAEKAGCLFIFAATAVRYIVPSRGSVNSRLRLQTVLNLRPRQGSKSHKDIDDLYTTILSDALDGEVFEQEELIIRRRVLWAVACASGPLTMSAIAELLSLIDVEVVDAAIQPLQSVLRISEINSMMSTLHASFPDFLLSEERAGQFFCNEVLQSVYLAERCFQIMEQSLQLNICRLESSYMLDKNVPDLQDRVDRVISNELFYACRYWGDHLAKSPYSTPLMNLLGSFMRHHLLSWIEVLNLKKHVGHGDGVLGQALAWLLPEGDSTDLLGLVNDARKFVVLFASSPTLLSTPHIYISALPFAPKQSLVWATYWPRTQGLIRVECKFSGLTGSINSVALSPDGTRAASGSDDCTISVRDTHNGAFTAGPFKGHTGAVTSVAFSPDGARIVSGSKDYTLRTWNAFTGGLLAGPFEGHTDFVATVSFSPDGNRVVSGSCDSTIRLWDSRTGEQVAHSFNGGMGRVTSIAFSPDGVHLVSGSWDHAVRMWCTNDRTVLLWTVVAHANWVACVAFSPDGSQVVSGSWDRTIMILDASNGTVLYGPLIGHTDWVMSVAVSSDGTHVVSGSLDMTVRLWNSQRKTMVTGPPGSRTGKGKSAVFFHLDIISYLADRTLRFWDAVAANKPAAKVFHGLSMNDDGWFTNSNSQRLLWVPPNLRKDFKFPNPSNPIIIIPGCSSFIDDSTLYLGDQWHKCYHPSPSPTV